MTTTPAPALRLSRLTKSFRAAGGETVTAVAGIDLRVDRGEVVALLGPNGAGKTTTLDMVLGLTAPTGGSVAVLDQPPRRAVADGRISAVLQTGGLLRDLTLRETVQMVASVYPRHAGVDEVIARAGLTRLAGRRVAKASGGEQQRLRFALALLPDPDLLVLDEPTAGMDVSARHEFWDAMAAEARSGRTIVFATHYLQEADAFAQRIVMLAGGRVVADGTRDEVRARASGRTVSAALPPAELAATEHRLRALPGVAQVQAEGGRVQVICQDSDAVARALLVDLGGRDLEVSTGSLDAAFLAITAAPAHAPGGAA